LIGRAIWVRPTSDTDHLLPQLPHSYSNTPTVARTSLPLIQSRRPPPHLVRLDKFHIETCPFV